MADAGTGNVRPWLGRHRPFVLAVAATMAVVLAAPRERGGEEVATRGAAGPASGAEPSAAGPPLSDGEGESGAAAVTASTLGAGGEPTVQTARPGPSTGRARPAGTPRRDRAGAEPGPEAAPGGPAAAGRYPGAGTPEALSNPNCDATTGRIRFPSRYSPPCVVPWPAGADNGGATHTGVSRDKIRVVVYLPQSNTRNEERTRKQWRDSVEVFDRHYELWGRQIELVFFVASGSDEVAQRADALKVATEIKPFMSTTGPATAELYSSEMAARGVVVWDLNAGWRSTQQQAPFRWASQNDDRTTIMHMAEYAGKRLARRKARWAGGSLAGRDRVFGLVYSHLWDKEVLDAELRKNGVAVADALSYVQGDTVGAQERARVLISRLKAKGVTSLLAGTDYVFNVVITKEATAQLFFPEWVMSGWGLQDVVLFARLNDQQQWNRAFGVGPVGVLVKGKVESGDTEHGVFHWHHGRKPDDTATHGAAWTTFYQSLACFQLAGPTLNPTTFRDGCFSFPPSGGIYCGCTSYIGVSFGRHLGLPWDDYTGWDDVTEKWWDPDTQGDNELGVPGPGVYQKVDGGKRTNVTQWPATEPKVFVRDGAVEFRDDYAPSDRPPSYPHKAH